jgi:hypothetical protein
MAVDEVGVTSDDQKGRQPGGYYVRFTDAVTSQVELVERSRWRHTCQPDSKRELGCMIFVQKQTLSGG